MNKLAWIPLGMALASLPLACRLVERPDLERPDLETLPIEAGTEPGSDDRVLSREVVLIADNQFRYTGGEGIVMTAALVDMFVPTAARPIALAMLADDVLRWTLEQNPDQPVIHLGDASDISCVAEFTWFAEMMRSHGAPWAMAPGNHDCMFMGSTMELEWEDDSWERACQGGGGAMDKADFVALYLGVLWDQLSDQPGGDELAAALGSSREELLRDLPEPGLLSERYPQLAERIRRGAPRGSWSSSDPGAFINGISWSIDEENTWRSYIAQRVSLTDPEQPDDAGFTGILLDTCQWWEQPQLIPINFVPPYQWNPGLRAELLADQLVVVGRWMDEATAQGNGVALFSHHPIKEYSPKSRRALEYLWSNHEVVMLGSGHTHGGYIDVHEDIAPSALEINVGSITDWPMEWRELQLSSYRRDDEQFFGVRSPRYTVLDQLVAGGVDLRENWETFEEGAKRFLSYRVTEDLALDYDTGVGDLLTGRQWLRLSTLGILTFVVSGQDTLARGLYNNVVPNIQGIQSEHLARRRLGIEQLLEIWDEFPTVGHAAEQDWAQHEAQLRQLAAIALDRQSDAEDINAAVWPMYSFELGREVADEEAMRQHRLLLAVWASLYEAHKTAEPIVDDENFRMIRSGSR